MPREAWRAALAGPPAEFEIDGDEYRIVGSWRALLEWLPFGEWHLELLYALVDDEAADRLDDRLDDDGDPLTLADVEEVAEALVEAATGRRWWVAQKLYAHISADWQRLEGAWMLRGLDLVALLDRPASLCNALYAYLTDGAGEQERVMFDARLERPPADLDVVEQPPVSDEEAGEAFLAAMAATKGGRIGAAVA